MNPTRRTGGGGRHGIARLVHEALLAGRTEP
jgi:hypothetical protein